MESNELKFLLKLLGCSDYRTLLSASTFDSLKNKTKICLALADRELVGFSHEITTIQILPPGSALLDMAKEELPIGGKELKILEKISKAEGKIKPSELNVKKAAERDAILQSLGERGLIEVETSIKRSKAEVWLTEQGQQYLRDDYTCKGTNPAISLDLLNNYISFFRKSLPATQTAVGTGATSQTSKLSDEEILQTIQDLDRELGTENYLPIFHLREKLQPTLSKEELDRVLYSLQRHDKIELSSVVDTTPYTPEQIAAGIPQDVGGALFFIIVN